MRCIPLLLIAALALVAPAGAAPESPDKHPLHVELRLVDGSVVKGWVAKRPLPFHTDMGVIEIRPALLRRIEMRTDRERVVLTFRNDDRLTAVPKQPTIDLVTLLGPVTVSWTIIESLAFVREGWPAGVDRRGLVLHLPLDEPGQRVKDASGHDNHGVVHGAAFLPKGRVGGARLFRGSAHAGHTILVPHGASLASMERSRQLTIAAWVRVDSLPEQFPVILSKGGNHPPAAYGGYELHVNWHPDNDLQFTSGPSSFVTYRAFGRWIDKHLGTWTHVAFTLDAATGEGTFYVNGRPTNDSHRYGPSDAPLRFDVGNALILGGPDPRAHDNRAYFDGALDDVMVFDRVLGAEEVKALVAAAP